MDVVEIGSSWLFPTTPGHPSRGKGPRTPRLILATWGTRREFCPTLGKLLEIFVRLQVAQPSRGRFSSCSSISSACSSMLPSRCAHRVTILGIGRRHIHGCRRPSVVVYPPSYLEQGNGVDGGGICCGDITYRPPGGYATGIKRATGKGK
jgi:hypothetical protein